MKRWIHASIDEGYTTFISENDLPEAVAQFIDADIAEIDNVLVKDAVDAFFAEYDKFPSSRTMESLDMKYDKDKGRFYRKYRPFVDKCRELAESINPSGYGMTDIIDFRIRDMLRAVDYNFPYGWKHNG